MMKKFAVAIIGLLLCTFQAEARPSGAPSAACRDLVPRHARNQAGDEPFPYKVGWHSFLMSCYYGGLSYKIQLEGTSNDSDFTGFLIQARTVGDDSPVGTFDSGTLHKQVCTGNTAATHVSRGQKTKVELQWIAPPAGTGPIRFWYSFVDIHRRPRSRFWAREKSIIINEKNCTVEGQIVQECGEDPECATTCANRLDLRICLRVCNGVCACPNGTIIDEDSNKCVPSSECPKVQCPAEGQVFQVDCAQENVTCSNFPDGLLTACFTPKCSCPRGQALDENRNKCVNISECRNCTVEGQIVQPCGEEFPTTCANRFFFRPFDRVCTGVCTCPNGTIIDEDSNKCVPSSECPEIPCPGIGQSFVGGCIPINATCTNPNPGILCDGAFCACPIGQVLDELTNTCVNVSQCTNCTVKGQVFKDCGENPECATTCANRFDFRFCSKVCNGVCECPDGTIIDEDSNECVPSSECPEIPCPGKGQVFAGGCNPVNATCSDPNPPILCDVAFCVCPSGQVLDELTNTCINVSQCPCPVQGQVRKSCAAPPGCAVTCTNRFTLRACPLICFFGGCECPTGMVIDEDSNKCVPISECPEIPCPGFGQVFGSCSPVNATCSNPNPPILCDVGFCACPFGQVLDELTNTCINVSQCISCSIKGQFPSIDCFGTNVTCSNPNPPRICDFPQCVCPRGQVIDVVTNACINGTQCRRGCNIRSISGRAIYSNRRKRLTLRFSANRQGQDALFECQIDDQQFFPCTSPMVRRNLNLRRGRHFVVVRGNCIYNGGVASTSSARFQFRVRN